MALKWHTAFPKAPALLEPHHQIALSYTLHTLEGSYPSGEKLSEYSTPHDTGPGKMEHRAIGLTSRMFVKSPGDSKMVLDAALLHAQHYKVWIEDKVEQSREWSSALPYTSV